MRELIIKTEDNIKIAVNHFSNNFDEVLIICPGWFMTKDSRAFMDMALEFSDYMDVLVMDFRGHGKSSGLYTFMSKESLDLKAVVNFARDKYKKVYLLGFSLGGGLVIIHSAVEKNVDKVIAVSAPADFYKIENHMWHPDAWIPTLFKKFEPKRWLSIRPELCLRKKLKPLELADKITCPVLLLPEKKILLFLPGILNHYLIMLFVIKSFSCLKAADMQKICLLRTKKNLCPSALIG